MSFAREFVAMWNGAALFLSNFQWDCRVVVVGLGRAGEVTSSWSVEVLSLSDDQITYFGR